jgi:penicillin G amidase
MSFQTRDTRGIYVIKWISLVIGVAALLAVLVAVGLYFWVRASVPLLDGAASLAKLSKPVTVSRDDNGAVSINAESAIDAIRALGFVHAQERFFEMDLARRSAAGELSALLGKATVPMDTQKRPHRFRARAVAEMAAASETERAWFSAYTEGVNAGLAALSARPWQYLVLRAEPAPWRAEDSLLVLAEMYTMLQQGGFESRFNDIRLRKLLGDKVFEWMRPQGGPWDAPLDGVALTATAMPTPADIDTRKTPAPPTQSARADFEHAIDVEQYIGSNNWAVDGTRTADGRAILANDMHLGLTAPGIWFRAQLAFKHRDEDLRVVGVTLPGMPQVVVGSNGHVAWGFTNNYGQFFDWVALPKKGEPLLAINTVTEVIEVKGSEPISLPVRETPAGPILKSDRTGGNDSDYALSWVAHRPGALMNRVQAIMFATDLDTAIGIAQNTPMPHQNMLITDRSGKIAWTVAGRIPNRQSWRTQRGTPTDPAALPRGWLEPAKYPLIKSPVDGQLWTANSRQLGGAGAEIIGDGGFDLGARATQIRDRLRETKQHTEATLYAIQLDRESRFLKPWAALATTRASAATTAPDAQAGITALGEELKRWNGSADVDQVGHRIARAFRERVLSELWRAWLTSKGAKLSASDAPEKSDAALSHDARFEYAAWQAIQAEAPHLLPPTFSSWAKFLDAQLVWVHDDLVKQHGTLQAATWGARNTSRIKHPFSRAMPFLSPYLDMPPRPLAGDNHLPRVANPSFGASQRLVVSPGKEEQAILTVAGGQSGHPLSPFYGAGHKQWLEGAPQPLLAGATRHKLTLSAQ